MIKRTLYKAISHYIFPNKGITHVKRTPRLIVSLTSYPRRIGVVHSAIDSILRQSIKPDMVLLWLAEEEFPQKEKSLPRHLRRYTKFGLTIKWCHNIRSYKKIIPALLEYPDDIIVTADDDIIYAENWLEMLYTSWLKRPNEIHCQHALSMELSKDFKILHRDVRHNPGLLENNEHTSSGTGILYPPHSLPAAAVDESVFLNLAPHDDDMWFWAMERLANIPIRLVEGFTENIVCIDEVQSDGLVSINSAGEGARQFANLLERYPQLKDGLKPYCK